MSDELLPYYERELAFIRELGKEFAELHPKIAGRLRLRAEGTEDPHVERLIEAFAYLNARTRHKLEDDFPEITDALLGVLAPHYQLPLPSSAIVQFALDKAQAALTGGYTIPRESRLETAPVDGEPCRFRTCYPVTVWPASLDAASLSGPPFAAPVTPHTPKAAAVLRLDLSCYAADMQFSQLELESLRFFLKGQEQHVFRLYEALFNNVLGVAVAATPRDADPALLDRHCIRAVGFERDEGLIPYPARSFLGYRLLTEYFAFPEKFLFFDLAGLRGAFCKKPLHALSFFFYLNRSTPDLERSVSLDTFQLGCTPMINLFRQPAEPIALTETDTEYHVVPDARRPLAHEIHTIDQVTATSPDDEQVEYRPFYSSKHAAAAQSQPFWHATRRPAVFAGGQADPGSEVFLSLVDLGFDPAAPPKWTLDVKTTCFNRDLPNRLPFGGGDPRLQLTDGGIALRVVCLTPPTPTLRPPARRLAQWRLISHLSLNHLSLADYEEGADALREILKLYDFTDSAGTRSVIDGVLSVRTRRVVGRTSGNVAGGFCRGMEITIHFDEDRFIGSGVYLFAAVLERFLGLYASLNSFSKLIATTNKREGELRRWVPRASEKVLL